MRDSGVDVLFKRFRVPAQVVWSSFRLPPSAARLTDERAPLRWCNACLEIGFQE